MVKSKKGTTKSVKQTKLAEQRELERRLELERLKHLEEETSSSSSSDLESSDSLLTEYEITEEENVVDIFEILDDSDSEILQEEEPEYVQRKTLLEKEDFFDAFGEIPNMDAISEDITVTSIPIEKPTEKLDPRKDMGKFVNPLTGQEMPDSLETKSSSREELEKETSDIEEEEQESFSKDKDSSQESDLLLPSDVLDIEEEDKKLITLEDTFEAFLELEAQPAELETKELDWETLAREEEAKRLQSNTLKFLNDLINRAVDNSEYMSPEKYLIKHLDKRKLIFELANKLPEYFREKGCANFINRQIVQHFKRKKSYRCIMEDNPKTLLQDKEKLKNAKIHLDRAMSKETKLKYNFEKTLKELKEKYQGSKEECKNKIVAFENNVKKYLGKEIWPKMNALIDQLLSQMRKYRQEVTQVRMSLLLQQHNQAHLEELLNKLEDLGNGLNMKDFSHLQAETQALDKKIEERNVELNKFHLRCHNDLHTWANYKEKQRMLSHTVSVQYSLFHSLVQEKHNLRERLFTLKLQRNRMQAHIKKLSIQGGLLGKPALMYDYDHTVERCREQNYINNSLKSTMRQMQKKIQEISKNFAAVRTW